MEGTFSIHSTSHSSCQETKRNDDWGKCELQENGITAVGLVKTESVRCEQSDCLSYYVIRYEENESKLQA
jgi:hypothetical protein